MLTGHVETYSSDLIAGWAMDTADPGRPVEVEAEPAAVPVTSSDTVVGCFAKAAATPSI